MNIVCLKYNVILSASFFKICLLFNKFHCVLYNRFPFSPPIFLTLNSKDVVVGGSQIKNYSKLKACCYVVRSLLRNKYFFKWY